MSRTLINPKGGEKLVTDLLSADALALLKTKPNDRFISSLAAAYPRLSPSQEFWFFKLAEGIKNPTAQPPQRTGVKVGSGFLRVQEMFANAIASKLKYPKIRLQDSAGHKIVLSLAPASGRNANHIYVKADDIYCGKISPEGSFLKVGECLEFVESYLQSFADDPAKIAAAYGHQTGNCCFCALQLTDKRSVKVGYGPICAEKYGLPWGE